MVAWYAVWAVLRSALSEDWLSVAYGKSGGAGMAPALEAPAGWAAWGALLVMSAANGFAEELVVRAYLMTRLRQLTRRWLIPLLASTLVFAAYHVYQGAPGVINALVIGLVYGVAFIRLRRFWPLAIAHALADVAGWVAISARQDG
jgi:membrane protease YdiL (CAAX protease family)